MDAHRTALEKTLIQPEEFAAMLNYCQIMKIKPDFGFIFMLTLKAFYYWQPSYRFIPVEMRLAHSKGLNSMSVSSTSTFLIYYIYQKDKYEIPIIMRIARRKNTDFSGAEKSPLTGRYRRD